MTRLRSALLLPALVLIARDAPAQRSVAVRADNDAFNFWQAPWSRPDEEYTSGVRLTVDYAGRAWWARRASDGCGDTKSVCAEHSYAFGQDIFTAARTHASPTPPPGARPDAGVLWLSATSRLVRPSKVTEWRWTLGVTGKPALAAPMQRFFHGLAPVYNRPIDWTSQLPAEPVFAAAYDQRRLRTLGALELEPHAGASLGNLLTEARVGIGSRFGWNLQPRGLAPRGRSPGWEFVGDATLRGVARNESLSGTFFRSSQRVALRSVVSDLQAGLKLRWRGLGVAWIAHHTSAEYRSRSGAHVWSTLEAAWTPGR